MFTETACMLYVLQRKQDVFSLAASASFSSALAFSTVSFLKAAAPAPASTAVRRLVAPCVFNAKAFLAFLTLSSQCSAAECVGGGSADAGAGAAEFTAGLTADAGTAAELTAAGASELTA